MKDRPVTIPDASRQSTRLWRSLRPWLIGAAALLFAAVVLHALRHVLDSVSYVDIVTAIRNTSWTRLLWALCATAISYLTLSGYDASALRYVGAQLKRSSVIFISFIAYALGNTIGLGVLTGAAVRMRLYMASGVEPPKITALIAFNALAFGIGLTTCGALALLWGAGQVAQLVHAPAALLRVVCVLALLAVGLFVAACARRRELRMFDRWSIALPSASLAIRQLAISALDLLASATALWVLLPANLVDPGTFAVFYVSGIVLGMISNVPGGVGVFEATILLACAGRAPVEQIAGALVLYRIIYYLVPLMIAALLLGGYELREGAAAPLGRAAVKLSPALLAALTLIGGVVLLISGVTPATDDAADLLALNVPLPLVEAAHFIGSVAGVALLFVARGLLSKLDAAWWAAVLLSIVAAVLAIPKGIAVSEAMFLAMLAVLLLVSRKQFDRPSTLFALSFERGWWLSIVLVLAACVWLLFFVYRDVDYVREVWWQFEFDGHAPRSLRALFGVAMVVIIVALHQLLREPGGKPHPPTLQELQRACAIVQQQPSAEACLVATGDKSVLFSESGNAFLMYGKRGRSWIALFDPVGPLKEWPELIWRFIELADTHGGRVAFYQVRPQALPLYLDAGLRAIKLGEEAHVSLPEFSLKGPRRANLRQGVNRGEREGLQFEVWDSVRARAEIDKLRRVSDAWLEAHQTREKGFSLGYFDAAYVAQHSVAVVRHHDRLVAFATLMHTEQRIEATVDLMRHLSDAPAGTMDYLFVKVMLHFQSQGYQRFGLGMAPMSGMATHPLAPPWHRVARFAFERGERFYNFRGLRSFKQKFDPVWEPRYLAVRGGLAPVFAMTDVATLISGGLRGVISK
jgi:phosphatidylglycerol lysyltransferase